MLFLTMHLPLVVCLIVPFALIEVTVQEDSSRNSQFERVSGTRVSLPFWTGQSLSPMECGAHCYHVTHCVAFSYHGDTLTCEVTASQNVYTTVAAWTTYIKEGCPAGWLRLNTFCYLLFVEARNWGHAKSICNDHGAHLAKILNQEQNDFLAGLVQAGESFWVGGNDQSREGNWVWEDTGNSAITWLNWRMPNPDNALNGQDCLRMAPPEYMWDDDDCRKELYFVCETNAHTV